MAALISLVLDSVQEGFEILVSIGAGTGLLYLLRWFWWRINTWCEVVAMISSFTISMVFFIMKKKYGYELPFAHTVLWTVGFTTLCWFVTAFVSSPTSKERLIAFYRKVHPAGPGWTSIREEVGVTEAEAALHGDHMGIATLGWISGCLTIRSSLFAIGNFLYGRLPAAGLMTGVFAINCFILVKVFRSLWREPARPDI